ncbi:MAG: pantoate--beta-alanine ligase [FCB group bacterium]|nr:pantoate--beta-alanine ligase [FCB group bacterium]
MELIRNVRECQLWRRGVSGSVGFVPTMGALHDGHLSLVRASILACDLTVVSIYVNPAQFGPGEDLGAYPRTLEMDLQALRDLQVSAVFLPADGEMYPPDYSTFVMEEQLSARLEGQSRPGHFRGVTTIVSKLFNIIRPDYAYFGRKDAQQLRVIRKMTRDLNYNIDIVACPTVREPDGLAMSSRNQYLTENERRRAAVIFRALSDGKALFENGERNAHLIRNAVIARISAEPLAKIDYISIADDASLIEFEGEITADALVSVAVFLGRTRLIDNITLRLKN